MFMGRRIISEHLTLVIKKKPRNATERQHVQITHEMSFEKKYGIALIWFCLTYALRKPMDYHPFIIRCTNVRDLKQTMMATAKRTQKNKRSN